MYGTTREYEATLLAKKKHEKPFDKSTEEHVVFRDCFTGRCCIDPDVYLLSTGRQAAAD